MPRPTFNDYLRINLEQVEEIVCSEDPRLSRKDIFLRACHRLYQDYEFRFDVSLDVIGYDSGLE